uniref:Uncharacterized protein n=1 Tax=Oncorhynchus tshawytscha TaxID=74940 RepID=A0AAZ3PZ24_ONCTS
MLEIGKYWGIFQYKEKWGGTKHINNLEENLVQSAFHQTLGEEFTFQQVNNLKHKAKSTLELLTKKTVNVPEWPSYSFDLNQLQNLWQDLNILTLLCRFVDKNIQLIPFYSHFVTE